MTEAASECGASESGAASTSKVAVEEGAVGGEEPSRPKHLELLPPPPRKDGKRSPLVCITLSWNFMIYIINSFQLIFFDPQRCLIGTKAKLKETEKI